MKNKKNFLILVANIAFISYLTAGLPKIFAILSHNFSQLFNISITDFNNVLYNATFFSLAGKIIFSFLINDKKFNEKFSIYKLFIMVGIGHTISIGLCLLPNFFSHVIGRYLQGLMAGIWMILLEPIIFNCSEPQWRNNLLYWKYELIALITPVAILITSFTNKYITLVLIIISLISLGLSWGVLFCKSSDNVALEKEENLLNIQGFIKSLKLYEILISNIIIGGILGLFIVLAQTHFYKAFNNLPELTRGILQGLPYSMAFIICKLPQRNYWQYGSVFCLMIQGIILLVNNFQENSFYFLGFIGTLYIIYVLWIPYLLTNILHYKPHDVSNRSVMTATQLIRSLSTLFITKTVGNFPGKLFFKSQKYYYVVIISSLIFSNLLLTHNSKNIFIKIINISSILIIFTIFISFL